VHYQQAAVKKTTIKSRFGDPQSNPAAAVPRAHWALAKAFAAEVGLTPSARTRIEMPTKTTEFDEFLFGPVRAVDAPEGAKEAAARELDRVKAVEAAEPTENEPAEQGFRRAVVGRHRQSDQAGFGESEPPNSIERCSLFRSARPIAVRRTASCFPPGVSSRISRYPSDFNRAAASAL
jgi:hypothetical protein